MPVAAVGSLPISAASPASGSVAGGTTVTITGSGFTAGAKVSFGGVAATAVVVVKGGTEIVCRTLPHAAGVVTVTVSVTTPFPKVGNLTNGFTYTSVAANPAPIAREFPIPTASSEPLSIAAGPDGNLWFVETLGDKIGRITPAGAITEFSMGITASSQPRSIAAGPDGNMWFTEINGGKIGRITPVGGITEFTTPPESSELLSIAAGPDGNMWFAGAGDNTIGVLLIAPPAITALSPISGPANAATTVTITGRNFAPGAIVSFGGSVVSSVVNSSTSITATAPTHGPGTVNVAVAISGSTASVDGFTYGTPDAAPPTRPPGSSGMGGDPLPPSRGGPTGGVPDAAPPPRPLFP